MKNKSSEKKYEKEIKKKFSNFEMSEYKNFLYYEKLCSICLKPRLYVTCLFSRNYFFVCTCENFPNEKIISYAYPYAGINCGIFDGEFFYINEIWYGRILELSFDDQSFKVILERRENHFFINNNLVSFSFLKRILSKLNITFSLTEIFNLESKAFKELKREISNRKNVIQDELFNQKIEFYKKNLIRIEGQETIQNEELIRKIKLFSNQRTKNYENFVQTNEINSEDNETILNFRNRKKSIYNEDVSSDKSRNTQIYSQNSSFKHNFSKTSFECIQKKDLLSNHTLSEILEIRRNKPFISESTIAGTGMFANKIYDKNEPIIFYIGEKISDKIAEKRDIFYKEKNLFYQFKINKNFVMDATILSNLAKFINHSCKPNCLSSHVFVNEKEFILIFAEEIISVGEELFYDYGNKREFDCHCGFC